MNSEAVVANFLLQSKFKKGQQDFDHPKPPRDKNFHKTHEGFYPNKRHQQKDRNYEYENRKERGYDEKKPHYKQYDKGYNKNWKKENENKDHERGEENKKPTFNPQRKMENKAIFSHQLKNIQKTIAPSDFKPKACPNPYSNSEVKVPKTEKIESKVTAFAGSGIVNDLMKTNDEFMIAPLGKEESKYMDSTKPQIGSTKDSLSKPSTGSQNKRSSLRFGTSAATMFTNQTGGKCTFTDYN